MRDIQDIWTHALSQELAIGTSDFSDYSVVLVIPDLFDMRDVNILLRILYNFMGFKQVSLIQASKVT